MNYWNVRRSWSSTPIWTQKNEIGRNEECNHIAYYKTESYEIVKSKKSEKERNKLFEIFRAKQTIQGQLRNANNQEYT